MEIKSICYTPEIGYEYRSIEKLMNDLLNYIDLSDGIAPSRHFTIYLNERNKKQFLEDVEKSYVTQDDTNPNVYYGAIGVSFEIGKAILNGE